MAKDKLKEILDTVKEGFPEIVEGGYRGRQNNDSECCCPAVVIYLIETNKLVINNAVCPNTLIP